MLRPYFHLVVRNWSFTHLLQLSLSYSVYCNYPIVMLQRIRPEMQFVFLEIGWKSTLMLLPSKVLWSQIWGLKRKWATRSNIGYNSSRYIVQRLGFCKNKSLNSLRFSLTRETAKKNEQIWKTSYHKWQHWWSIFKID